MIANPDRKKPLISSMQIFMIINARVTGPRIQLGITKPGPEKECHPTTWAAIRPSARTSFTETK